MTENTFSEWVQKNNRWLLSAEPYYKVKNINLLNLLELTDRFAKFNVSVNSGVNGKPKYYTHDGLNSTHSDVNGLETAFNKPGDSIETSSVDELIENGLKIRSIAGLLTGVEKEKKNVEFFSISNLHGALTEVRQIAKHAIGISGIMAGTESNTEYSIFGALGVKHEQQPFVDSGRRVDDEYLSKVQRIANDADNYNSPAEIEALKSSVHIVGEANELKKVFLLPFERAFDW